jgi:hypothetical protein
MDQAAMALDLTNFRFGPSALTASVTWLTTFTNFVDSADEIQENCRRPGSTPICTMRF